MQGPPGGRATDAEARFRELFDANYLSVLAYGIRRAPCGADAADLAAETTLVAWRRIDEVPPGKEVLPWLYGVARRVLANQARAVRRRDRLSARLAAEVEQLVVPDVAPPWADRAWVRAGLAELNDLDREVLTLTVWEELSSAEVAMALDIPAATVRSRLHRARRRLREHLDESAEAASPRGEPTRAGERPLVCDGEETR